METPFPLFGALGYWPDEMFDEASIPIPMAVSFVFPFIVAPFTRFRFPLWSYFAWTALVAVELAYYLR
jgi:hypothetical protein